jgi:putative inorganic carbon (hco3(-)) transporter
MSKRHRKKYRPNKNSISRKSSGKSTSVTPQSSFGDKLNIEKTSSDYAQLFLIFLFHLMVIVVPFFFTWVNEELFEFNKMILVYGFTILISATWIIRMILSEKLLIKRSFLDIPLALFFASQLLSTIFSMHPRTSVFGYYTRFHGGLLSTISYITLYYAFINNFNRKQLKYFLLSIFVAALGVALYAIPEHFGYSPSCAMIAGEFNADCWQQEVQHRIFGTFGQPNWLAAYAILLIPVGISFTFENWIETAKQNRNKIFGGVYFLAVILLLATLIFTKSRSGFLGLSVSGFLYLLGLGFIYWRNFRENRGSDSGLQKTPKNNLKIKFPFKIGAALAGCFLTIILIFGSPFTPQLKNVLTKEVISPTTSSTTEAQAPVIRIDFGGTDSGEIRKIVWQGAFDVWKRYPILGSGVETFAYSYYLDRPLAHNLVSEWDFLYNKAHNEFLNFLATTGVVGLSAYLLLLSWFSFAVFKFIIQTPQKNTPQKIKNKLFALGLIAGLVALSISNFFGFSTVMVSTLMFLYFAFFEIISKNETPESKTKSQTPEFWHYLGMGAVVMTALFLSWQVFSIWQADYLYTKGKRLVNSGYLSDGGPYLQEAITKRPNEALFYDKLATTLAKMSLEFAKQDYPAESEEFFTTALATSEKAMELNPVHLNFHKTRIRALINLGQLNPKVLDEALIAINQALVISPTDAKLVYNLGLLQEIIGNEAEAIKSFNKAIEMKPGYSAAEDRLIEINNLKTEDGKKIQKEETIIEASSNANLNPENLPSKKTDES